MDGVHKLTLCINFTDAIGMDMNVKQHKVLPQMKRMGSLWSNFEQKQRRTVTTFESVDTVSWRLGSVNGNR